EASGDPALQRELAAAYDRLGSVLGRPYAANLGDTAGAMTSYRKALQIREALAAADPRNPQARRELAQSHRRIGWQLMGTTEFDASRDHFRQAIAIYTQLVTEQPGDTENRVGLVSAHNEFGGILGDRNDLAGALENHRRALALLEEAPAETRGTPEFRRRLSITHENIGRSLFLSGDDAAGLDANAKALALRTALASEDPTNAIFRRMVAISYQNDGDYRDHAGDSGGALASFRRKLAIDEELFAADPANAQAGGDLAYTLLRLGDLLAKRGVHSEALVYYRRSAEQWERLQKPSGDTTLNPILAVSHAGVARAQANLGNQSAALDAARRAETVVATGPDDVMNSGQRELRAQTYEYLAEAHLALATRHGISPADAKGHWSAACRTLQQSGEVWADMRRRGILWGTDASKPDTLARKIEDCRTKLGGT
ncbi:MAG: tetratricopeptide repeat protein, partial [Acidobacteriota bacterium]